MAVEDSHQVPSQHDTEEEKLDEASDRQPDSVSNDEEKGVPPAEVAAEAEAKPAAPPGPPGGPAPNGGTKAWLQVLGGWMLFFNTWVSSTSGIRLRPNSLTLRVGRSQHLWCLPDLLRRRRSIHRFIVGHLMDRLHPVGDGAPCGRLRRPHLRPRSSSLVAHPGYIRRSFRAHDA